jgi:hypothetical protein
MYVGVGARVGSARDRRMFLLVRRRGVGEYPGQVCYDPARPRWYPNWVSTPTELACVMTSGAASLYQRAEYGRIPTVADLGTPPAPNAPQTPAEMLSFTPDQSTTTPDQWAVFQAQQRAVLDAAAAGGSWNPAGNLPSATAVSDFFSQYGGALLAGGLVLGGLYIFGGGRRH